MLEIERFDPPRTFVKNALLSDPAIYEEAEQDWKGWWLRQAKELHWFKEPSETLDDSNPPFYKWFADGKINASYNCLDRHVEAGNGDRVAFHWRGEEGEERDLTYADLHRDVQRFANALKDLGIEKGDIVGIYLPMIPEVVVAMLACARIGAPHNVVFGGFSADSVKERMEFSEAKALITIDGARRKGKTAPIKQQVDEVMARSGHARAHRRGQAHRRGLRDAGRPRRVVPRGHRGGRRRVPGRGARRRAPAVRALHQRLDRQAQGRAAHDRRLHDRGQRARTGTSSISSPSKDVYWCSADVGWVTGHSYIVYGPMANGATSVMYEGAPDYPHKGIWWELCERYGVTQFYTAPTAIRACIKWGVEHVEKFNLSKLRLLGSVGEPINPKAWLWYYKVVGGERCPIVDTWWQTETGAIMITPLPGIVSTKPGSATPPVPRDRGGGRRRARGQARRDGQGLLVLRRPWPSMLRTLYKEDDRFVETYFSRFGKETYLVGDAARQGQGRLLLDHRPDRRRRQRLGPPAVHRRGRVGDRLPPEGRRGGRDRPDRRGHRPGDLRVRHAPGHDSRAPTSWSRTSAATSPTGSASSPGPSGSSGPTTSPRPARARSCAGCCATSPRAARSATSPRCATPT